MIPVAFDYERATSIDDAIAKLGASNGGKLIAGGHSLVPLMKLRLSEPGKLVDISRIPGLSGIKEAGGRIEIGATTTHTEIAASKLLRDKCPMIAEAAAEIGDRAGQESRHDRRQHRARGSRRGFSGGGARARCRHSAEGQERRANGEGVRVLPRLLRRRSAAGRADRRRSSSRRSRSAAYAKLHQRASHYADRRRRGGARREGRRHSIRPHRPHRRDDACGATGERREGAGRQEGGWHRGRGGISGRRRRRPERAICTRARIIERR